MQRVRVGMTGLALVLVLIGLASVIFTAANREQPVSAVGAPNAAVVANITDGSAANAARAEEKVEPLATLGVAPSTTSTEAVNAAEIARRVEAQRQAEAARK